MIVQSLLNKPSVFQIGKRSTVIPANGVWTLLDADERAFRDARKHEDLGHLIIVEGPKIKQDISSRTLPANASVAFTNVAAVDNATFTVRNMTSGINTVYTFRTGAGTAPAGTILITADAASAANTAEAFADALNANTASPVKATKVGTTVYLHHKALGKSGSTVGLKSSLAGIAVTGGDVVETFTKLADGVYGASVGVIMQTVVATAATVTLVTGLPEISHVVVQVRTAAGAIKAYDGAVTWTEGVITADSSGATDIAATDRVVFMIFG